jgi:hypothetical protein
MVLAAMSATAVAEYHRVLRHRLDTRHHLNAGAGATNGLGGAVRSSVAAGMPQGALPYVETLPPAWERLSCEEREGLLSVLIASMLRHGGERSGAWHEP